MTITAEPGQLLTTGSIARLAETDRDRVTYIVRKLGLQPAARNGSRGVRIFSPEQAEEIVAEVRRIDAARQPAIPG